MKRILLFCFTISSFLISYAETYWNYNPYTTEGTEFYVTFMPNAGAKTGDESLKFYLYASTRSEKEVTITVENIHTNFTTTFTCTKSTVGRLEIEEDNLAYLENENIVYSRVLKVTSGEPISLYASNYNESSYAATNIMPVEALSVEYLVQTYSSDQQATEFAVLAIRDNTKIHIMPSDTIKGNKGTNSITINLDQGQAYLLRANKAETDDLSGTVVCSDKPIAVFNGGQNSKSVKKQGSADHIVEQTLPTYMWGKEFIVSQSKVQDYNVVKITAMYDSTKIYINNQEYKTLNKKESYEFIISKPDANLKDAILENRPRIKEEVVYVNTTYPTSCFLYHTSESLNNEDLYMSENYYGYGDPTMISIPPLEQNINAISFLTNNINNNETYHLVNIVTKTTNINNIKLDGNNISSHFSVVGGNNSYSFARIEIDEGSHTINSTTNEGFLAYSYGLYKEEAYGYNIGNTLLPMGAYMLIEGKRVNEMSFCFNDIIDIEGIINYEYDNIEWYMDLDNEPNTIHHSGNKIIQHRYDAIGIYNIKMVVTKKNILCPGTIDCPDCGNTQDTVFAKLHIFDTYNVSQTEYICDGESYNWQLYEIDTISKEKKLVKDTIITTTGIFKETLKSVTGCDSVITLITKNASHVSQKIDIITYDCRLPYKFNDNLDSLTQEGVYYDTLQTIYGYDSVIIVDFKVYPCYEERDTICFGSGVYVWENHGTINIDVATTKYEPDQTYTFEDTLDIDLGKGKGFYTLKLYIAPIYEFSMYYNLCDNESIYWRGETIDIIYVLEHFEKIEQNTYVQRDCLLTDIGCDSCWVLYIRLCPTYLIEEVGAICSNQTYMWRDFILTDLYSAGTYVFYDSLKTVMGCDSVYKLTLHVNQTYSFVMNDTICENEEYMWEGQIFDNLQSGSYVFYDSLKTVMGCDSVYKLTLHVNQTYSFVVNDTIYENEEYMWEGQIFDNLQSGSYVFYDSLKTVMGCDSIYYLNLTVNSIYDNPTSSTIIEDKMENANYPVLVSTANSQQKTKSVILNANDKGTYVLYDILGHVILRDEFNSGDSIELLLPDVSSCYLLLLFTEQYGYKCIKLSK